jgi:hypothetical protein
MFRRPRNKIYKYNMAVHTPDLTSSYLSLSKFTFAIHYRNFPKLQRYSLANLTVFFTNFLKLLVTTFYSKTHKFFNFIFDLLPLGSYERNPFYRIPSKLLTSTLEHNFDTTNVKK